MKKLSLFLAVAVMLGSVAFAGASVARADDDNNRGSSGKMKVEMGRQMEKMMEAEMKPEIHIGPNGKVLVRGAKITAISGTVVTAQVSWGSYNSTWNVNALNATIIRKAGGKAAFSDLAIGHVVSFSGVLDTAAATATVNADTIKDWSAQNPEATKITLQGELKAMSTTSLPAVLTVRANGVDYAVSALASTAILNRNWAAISLNTFVVGDTVRFYGPIAGTNATATVIRNVSR